MGTTVWLGVVGYESLYEVSDRGGVRSLIRRRGARGNGYILKTPVDNRGYAQVNLYRDRIKGHHHVHQLVAEAFHGPRPPGTECRHLDGDSTNNAAKNLAWGTSSENNLDQVRHGTFRNVNTGKTVCDYGHEFTDDNTTWVTRTDGTRWRMCIACRKRRNREQSARRLAARRAARAT